MIKRDRLDNASERKKKKKCYLRTANPHSTAHIHHNALKKKLGTDRLEKRMGRK